MAGYSKREFVIAALTELGIAASSGFQIQADELVSACNRLDAMMAEWDAGGIHIGYPIDVPVSTDLDATTSVYPYAVEAVVTNLAIKLAPSYGKSPSPDTKATAKSSKATVIMRMTTPSSLQFPDTLPSGAGNKPDVASTFLPGPTETIDVADEGALTFTP